MVVEHQVQIGHLLHHRLHNAGLARHVQRADKNLVLAEVKLRPRAALQQAMLARHFHVTLRQAHAEGVPTDEDRLQGGIGLQVMGAKAFDPHPADRLIAPVAREDHVARLQAFNRAGAGGGGHLRTGGETGDPGVDAGKAERTDDIAQRI